LPIAVNIPGFDAHRSDNRSYAIGNRECCCLLQSIYLSDFDAHRSYDRSYAIGNRECLLPIAVSMSDFDAYRNCYKVSLL
jgi:hypothetical protein